MLLIIKEKMEAKAQGRPGLRPNGWLGSGDLTGWLGLVTMEDFEMNGS